MTRRLPITICLLVVLLPICAGLSFLAFAMFSGGSAGGTLASGRSVLTYSDSMFLSSELRGDTAVIKTDGKIIVVKPTTLVVDGANVACIDERVSVVEVTIKNGMINFVADGKTVATTLR